MLLPYELYRIFYVTASEKSFSKAAEKLCVSQPAVSQSIKTLETMLKTQLFVRLPRGVGLTRSGEVLFYFASRSCQLMEAGEKKIMAINDLLEGELTIGASDSICRYYLLPFLKRFHTDYPAVKIRITNRTSLEIMEMLKQGRVDLGIVNLPAGEEPFKITEIMAVHDCIIAGERYRELKDRTLAWEEFGNYPLLMLERLSHSRRIVEAYLRSRGLRFKPEIELGSFDLLVEFARIGLGLACVIREFVKKPLESGVLFEISLPEPLPARSIGIITLKNIPVTAAAGRFISYCH